MKKRKYALKGLKVVDFSWVFTGPIVTKYLGDHGAEVIKIESATRPDGTRVFTPFKDGILGLNRSGVFANYNSSKYSININLREPRGKEIVHKLVERADIVLETFGPGTMKKLDLDYDRLQQVKSDIIMLSMSMVGQYGPHSDQPSFGQVLQATNGFVHLLGWPDRPPCLPVAAYTDFIAPWYVLIALMSALDYRRRTGKGQYIDLAMLECSVHPASPVVMDYAVNSRVQNRMGNRNPMAAPHGVYPCKGKERWCAIAVFNDREWRGLCKVMGNPEWTESSKFDTLLHRKENVEELDKLMGKWTRNFTPEEIMARLQLAGVAAGVVQTGEDMVDHDPQLRHRDHFEVLEHAEMGTHISERPPFRLSRTPSEPQRPFPSFGEHTEYVAKEILGMGDEEFAELIGAGVLA
ncbi:MAG: CoA transferase [Dehalococcoidia bacterium]|nr:MAG: CoA transferase [Dehalococcoidia bacterium]